MKITFISDLHGERPELPGGELLIIAGDLTGLDKRSCYEGFFKWLVLQKYEQIVFIGGNHDVMLQLRKVDDLLKELPNNIHYLYDSEIILSFWDKLNPVMDDRIEKVYRHDIKIYGSPWTSLFHGVNPHCTAFMIDEKKLGSKFMNIPDDTDILITHSPPFGILDEVNNEWKCGERTGSKVLRDIVLSRERMPNLKVHVFGHIHGQGGKVFDTNSTKFINASILDESYIPNHKIITIDYPYEKTEEDC